MRIGLIRLLRGVFLFVVLLTVATAAWSIWAGRNAGSPWTWLSDLTAPEKTLTGLRVGILPGHSGYDSGATCADGLTEAGVNAAISDIVVREIEARGASVDVFEEFDPALDGYLADAFVAIHADSCDVDMSGFKVASQDGRQDNSGELADCLWASYEEATKLPRNYDTITIDMTDYHAFRAISAWTPAAIVETGFLSGDRRLLTRQQKRVARGIVSGIECFLSTP